MPRYNLFYKNPGVPIMHPNMRAPYQLFNKAIKTRQTFKFDVLIMPQNISKSYIHRRYTNLFAHFLWSRANRVRLKPIIMATPNEQFEFSKGNILTLFKSTIFKHSSLLNTNQPGSYFSAFFNSKPTYLNLSKYFSVSFKKFKSLFSSLYTSQSNKVDLFNLSNIVLSESKYWNSQIITWRIQQNTLYGKSYTPKYRFRYMKRIKKISKPGIRTDLEDVRRAGSLARFDTEIYTECLYHDFIRRLNKPIKKSVLEDIFRFYKYYSYKANQRFHKLKLIKRSRNYTHSVKRDILFLTKSLKKEKKFILRKNIFYLRENYKTRRVRGYPTRPTAIKRASEKKKMENFLLDPPIPRVKHKTMLKNIRYEGIDWKMFHKFDKLFPSSNDKHLNPLFTNFIKKISEGQHIKFTRPHEKNNKLIVVKKKDVTTGTKKNVLSELHETISDLLKNDTFSWVTFHEYREELMRNQTTSIPGGIISSLITTFGLGSILTFILLAADYHRAPNKKGASRLVSWKAFMIFLLCSFLVYITIDITGYDIFIELLKSSESPVGIQKVPQHVILPHQINHTIDDFNKNIFRTPFFTKKESTWHSSRLEPIIDYIYTKMTKTLLEIAPGYIPEDEEFKLKIAEEKAAIARSKFSKPFEF